MVIVNRKLRLKSDSDLSNINVVNLFRKVTGGRLQCLVYNLFITHSSAHTLSFEQFL